MKSIRQNNAITLIIVLLTLTGITTISSLVGEGRLHKAMADDGNSELVQVQERMNMLISDIAMEKIANGIHSSVTMEELISKNYIKSANIVNFNTKEIYVLKEDFIVEELKLFISAQRVYENDSLVYMVSIHAKPLESNQTIRYKLEGKTNLEDQEYISTFRIENPGLTKVTAYITNSDDTEVISKDIVLPKILIAADISRNKTNPTVTTAAIIRELNSAIYNDVHHCILPAGDYLIDPGHIAGGGGIVIPSDMIFEMEKESNLYANYNDAELYSIIKIEKVDNVTILGGNVIGDWLRHSSTEGQWGHCIRINSASNVHIDGVTVENAWGDGIYLGTYYTEPERNNGVTSDILIENCTIINNRRQGITVGSSRNIIIRNNSIYESGRLGELIGTSPMAGINAEAGGSIEGNIFIENLDIYNNKISGCGKTGIVVCKQDKDNRVLNNVTIKDNIIEDNPTGIIIEGSNITIENNLISNSINSSILMESSGENIQILNNIIANGNIKVASYCRMEDILINSNKLTNSGIYLLKRSAYKNNYKMKIINNTFEGGYYGFLGNANSIGVEIIENTFSNHLNTAIYAGGCNEFKISNNVIENSEYGIRMNDSYDMKIMENLFRNHSNTAIYASNSHELKINNNIVESSEYGMRLVGSYNAEIMENTFSDYQNTAIYASRGYTLKLNNNFIKNSKYGMRLFSCYDTEIKSNIFDYCERDTYLSPQNHPTNIFVPQENRKAVMPIMP